jgi:hypothetical protein
MSFAAFVAAAGLAEVAGVVLATPVAPAARAAANPTAIAKGIL